MTGKITERVRDVDTQITKWVNVYFKEPLKNIGTIEFVEV